MRRLAWSDDVAVTVAGLRALAPPPARVQAAAAGVRTGANVSPAVAHDSMWAVQSPPEKSLRVGPALPAGLVATVHREAGTS